VSVRYGKTLAVDRISLVAKHGEVTALVGPNGSGKSSLLKAVAGLLRSDGEIRLPEHSGSGRVLGYMPQDTTSNAALTVLEVVLLGRYQELGLRLAEADMQAAIDALGSLGIQSLASRYLGELSGGQRQLVFLAQVLANKPLVLLLDEPISALDIHHQLHVLETIKRLTVARSLVTIVVLHDLTAAARHADRLAIMADGRLAGEGSPIDVLTANLIRQVFQVDAAIQEGPGGKLAITALRCAHGP
jgi:iron complex transport system ATP-binding protein